MKQETQQAVRRQDRIDCLRSELDRLRRLHNNVQTKVRQLPQAWREKAAHLHKTASGEPGPGARALQACAEELEAALSTTTTPRRSL